MTKEPFVLCGELGLRCQSGGYYADAFEVDGKDLDELVRDHFGIRAAKATESEHDDCRSVGRARIIIELLPNDIERNEVKIHNRKYGDIGGDLWR